MSNLKDMGLDGEHSLEKVLLSEFIWRETTVVGGQGSLAGCAQLGGELGSKGVTGSFQIEMREGSQQALSENPRDTSEAGEKQ